MINGDYIRNMDDDRLARFLMIWQINFLSMFFESGFEKTMDAKQLREWVGSDKWECEAVHVNDDFIFDSAFNLREGDAGQ